MIKLLASDLDGTIIDNKNQITKQDLSVIDKLTEVPVNFAICTGKTYSMTKDICKKLNATYGVFGNGTQIINLQTGEEIERNVITPKQALDCIEIANNNNLHIHIYTDGKIIAQKELKYMSLRNFYLHKQDLQFEVVDSLKDFINEKNPSILKLVISGEKDLNKIKEEVISNEDVQAIQIKKYNQYKDNVIDQEYEYLDIVPKNTTKYNALKKLSSYLKVSNDEIMAVGDNINDIEMIKNAGVGVAIGGSLEDVTNVSSYVTKNDVKSGGFAEAVYKFIEL